MIDFRYHLVSLISVFMALAVGIALGAGPLKETIGDALTGQVDQLRTERADLRGELDVAHADLRRADGALDAIAGDLLEDVLGERRVALVVAGELEGEVLEGVQDRLHQAGGSVSAVVRVTDEWVDPAQSAFRQSLAGRLVEYLDPRPPDDGGTDLELAEALVQGLATAAADDPDALSEDALLVLELLREAELISLDGAVSAPADLVVVLKTPAVSATQALQDEQDLQTGDPEVAELEDARHEALARTAILLARTAQARTEAAVLAGGDVVPNSVLEMVRQDRDTSRELTTVEAVQRTSGQIAVPLALAARVTGEVAHYGASPSAERPMPDWVVLPPVQRLIPVPEQPDGTGDDDAEGEPGTDEETGAGDLTEPDEAGGEG